MKKRLLRTILSIVAGIFTIGIMPVFSHSEDLILDGVYAENIPLGGMSEQEANDAINVYLEELSTRSVTLYTVNDNEVIITPKDLGFKWANPEIIKEAVEVGHKGNVVERYKTCKDLTYSGKIFDIKFSLDDDMVRRVLSEECASYNMAARDGIISLEGGSFEITEGQAGMVLDIDASAKGLEDFFLNQWSGQNTTYQLIIKIDAPNGTYEDLALVKDCLGTFHTSFKTSSAARSSNVRNGASLINGSVIYPGEEYSFYDHVKPFSYDNGYQLAAAYSSGQVVDSVGGGICQVSSTLYNSVLLSELEVTERRNHGMIVTYVDPARDATIAESAGTDFRFVNNTDAPIYIDAYTTDDKQLYISIYGHETRPSDRKVEYESEVTSRMDPGPDVYIEDPSHPIGYISTQSAHVGIKANLWKVVTQNGETVRELVNSSTYNPAPKYITVGTATEDPSAAAALSAAIASGDTDTVKSTASSLKSAADAGISADAQALAQYEAALAAMNSAPEE